MQLLVFDAALIRLKYTSTFQLEKPYEHVKLRKKVCSEIEKEKVNFII